MITVNFFKDGAYVKGHDVDTLCTLVSYAMFSCINDSILANENVIHYQSAHDKDWSRLGLMFIKIDTNVEQHLISLSNLRGNLWNWLDFMYQDRIKVIDRPNDLIDWNEALIDAKREQGYIK